MPSLLSRLKERKLVQWALAYAAGGWALLEAADLVGGQFHWPEPLLQGLTILVGMGFLAVLVVAWHHGEKGRQRVSGSELLALAVLSILAGVLISSLGPEASEPEPPLAAGPAGSSVAVLPFTRLSGGERDFFDEGLHEALITDLSRVTSLRVISRTSVMRYADDPPAIRDIARELGVSAVVESSVLRSGDRVRVTARLLDGATERHLWTASFEHEVRDVLRLTAQVARAVAEQLALALSPLQDSLLAASSVGPRALEAYLEGRYALNRLRFAEALRHFQRAIDLDRGFAGGWSGQAFAQYAIAYFGSAPYPEYGSAMEEARGSARRALELDERVRGANTTLGFIRLYVDWDWEGAGEEFRRALALDPNDVGARHGYGDLLTVLGREDEGLRQVELGRQSDPLSLVANGPVIGHLFFARRFEDMLAEMARLRPTLGDLGVFDWFESFGLWHLGDQEAAVRSLLAGWREDAGLRADVERALRESGPEAAVGVLADRLAEQAVEGGTDEVNVAVFQAMAGRREGALSWLERAYDARRPDLLHATVHPAFDLVRAEPAFQDLLRRIGLPTGGAAPGS